MKVRDLLRCDFCFREGFPDKEWWQNWNGFFVIPGIDGLNGGFRGENLCPQCRSKINSVLDKLSKEVKTASLTE